LIVSPITKHWYVGMTTRTLIDILLTSLTKNHKRLEIRNSAMTICLEMIYESFQNSHCHAIHCCVENTLSRCGQFFRMNNISPFFLTGTSSNFFGVLLLFFNIYEKSNSKRNLYLLQCRLHLEQSLYVYDRPRR